MKNSLIATCLVALSAIPGTLYASQPAQQDSTRNSLIKHFTQKEMPKSIQFDLHVKSTFNAEFPNPTSGKDEAKFRFNHLMVDLHGNITDKLSYKYLQRVHRGVEAFETENLSSSINYAYLTYQFNQHYALTAGRQAVSVGGFEYYEYPIDIYDFSLINNNFTCYLTGLQFNITPSSSQEIIIQVLNNRQGNMSEAYGALPTNIERPFAPLYYTLAWNSSYNSDFLKLRCSATTGEQAKGKWMFMAAAGARFQWGKCAVYLDQLYTRSAIDHLGCIRNMTSIADENGIALKDFARNTEYLSTILDFNYHFTPQWNLHLKGYYDRGSVFKTNDTTEKGNYISSWGYQGAIEFYPMKDNNLRIFTQFTRKNYRKCRIEQTITPDDELRLSLGFCYRLPIL